MEVVGGWVEPSLDARFVIDGVIRKDESEQEIRFGSSPVSQFKTGCRMLKPVDRHGHLTWIRRPRPPGALGALMPVLRGPALDITHLWMRSSSRHPRLGADEQTKDIPVVILSNYSEQELVERGLNLGALEYLIKSETTPAKLSKGVEGWRSEPSEPRRS